MTTASIFASTIFMIFGSYEASAPLGDADLLPEVPAWVDWVDVTTPEDVLVEFTNNTADIRSIECDFTQTKHMDVLVSDVVSHGTFSFKAATGNDPETVVITYSEPEPKIISIKGSELSITDGDGNVTVIPARKTKRFTTMVDVMKTGGVTADSDWGHVRVYERAGYYRFLIPSDSSGMFAYIEAFVDKADLSLISFRVYDSDLDGDYTELVFTNKRIK